MARQQEAELRILVAVVDSLRTPLKVAEEIESLRRREYNRLLALQGDDVVTAQETQQAFALLQAAAAELKTLQSKLRERESKLGAWNDLQR